MSIADQLDAAAFPLDYADILIETLSITPGNLRDVQDAVRHFRRLDDDQAGEVIARILETLAERSTG